MLRIAEKSERRKMLRKKNRWRQQSRKNKQIKANSVKSIDKIKITSTEFLEGGDTYSTKGGEAGVIKKILKNHSHREP